MDLNSLNIFIAIARTDSFSEAGERLHLTQPAVNKRIAALKQQLNTRLFDQAGREVNLTKVGCALLPRVYQLPSVLDDTRRALSNLTGEVSGRLVLAASHHVGLHRLPPLLRAFTRAHPQVALNIQFLDPEVACEEILHGHAELAVITLAPETAEPARAVPVWNDPLGFVAAPKRPLTRQSTMFLADVAKHPAIFSGDNAFAHHIVRRMFEAEELTPNIVMSTNYLETIKIVVSIGLTWSMLLRTMLDDQVVRLPLQDVQLSRQLGCILHAERTLSNAARAFVCLLDGQAFDNNTPAA